VTVSVCRVHTRNHRPQTKGLVVETLSGWRQIHNKNSDRLGASVRIAESDRIDTLIGSAKIDPPPTRYLQESYESALKLTKEGEIL
jgi:hypothetical protein